MVVDQLKYDRLSIMLEYQCNNILEGQFGIYKISRKMESDKISEHQYRHPKIKSLISDKFASEMLTFIAYLRHAPKTVQDILAPYAIFLADDKFNQNKTIQRALEKLKRIKPLFPTQMSEGQLKLLERIMEMLNLQKFYKLISQNEKGEKSFTSFLGYLEKQSQKNSAKTYTSTVKIDLIRPQYYLTEMIAKYESQVAIGQRFSDQQQLESIFYKQPRLIDKVAEIYHWRKNAMHRGNIALLEYSGNFIVGRRVYAIGKDSHFQVWQKSSDKYIFPFPDNPLIFKDFRKQFTDMMAGQQAGQQHNQSKGKDRQLLSTEGPKLAEVKETQGEQQAEQEVQGQQNIQQGSDEVEQQQQLQQEQDQEQQLQQTEQFEYQQINELQQVDTTQKSSQSVPTEGGLRNISSSGSSNSSIAPPVRPNRQKTLFKIQPPKKFDMQRSFKFIGHSNKVTCASLSQDEFYIITGSVDKTVKLWCLRMNILLATYNSHFKTVWDVHFNPSGLYFLSGGADGLMILWKTDQPKPQRIFLHKSDVYKVHFAKNPSFAISAGEEGILRIWHIIKAQTIKVIYTQNPIINFNIGHSGAYIIVIQTDGRITLHNIKKGQLVSTFYFYYKGIGDTAQKRQAVHDVCLSEDQKNLVCVTTKHILLYSMQSLQLSQKSQNDLMVLDSLLNGKVRRQKIVQPYLVLMSYDNLRFTFCRFRNRGILIIGGTRYLPQ